MSQMPSAVEFQTGDSPLVVLFRHNLWANLRLLDACAALDARQLAETAVGGYGALYDTLNHIVRAEQGYLIHLTGQPPAERLRRDDPPDAERLRALAQRGGEALIALAAAATPEDRVLLVFEDGRWHAPAGLVLMQAINHATEHRAQVATILTQLGLEPPDMSGWLYGETYMSPEPAD